MPISQNNAQDFQRITQVSKKTLSLYQEWFSLLKRWNQKINLVSASTLNTYWSRHALDSHQLSGHLPKGSLSLLDLGSGGGFPGLALAIAMKAEHEYAQQACGAQENSCAQSSGLQKSTVVLVEANGKKCNFLRAVIRALDLPANVLQERAENVLAVRAGAARIGIENFTVITARAFAPLPQLFGYCAPYWQERGLGVFSKGESWATEVEAAKKHWDFDLKAMPSQTNDKAKILLVTGLRAKHGH